jgi:hypothetical protein
MLMLEVRYALAWLAPVAVAGLASTAHAQWVSDPAINLMISDPSITNVQPKVVARTDGGFYVSWFGGPGFDVWLQRLDSNGNMQWAAGGVLVANLAFSSTQDYDLAVDADDNALLSFRDDRFGGTKVTAQMVAPDGSFPWGDNGVQFGDGTTFVGAPKIEPASDGEIVVAWTYGANSVMQRLDGAGTILWANALTVTNPEVSQIASDLVAADNGSVILSTVAYASFSGAKHLYAHKIDGEGNALWPAPLPVLQTGSLQNGNFPPFVSDGNGGGVFAWYTSSPLQCFVQHVLADGSESLPHNGLAVSTDTLNQRVSPTVAYDSGDIYVFWRELRQAQSQSGVYGQRIDADGALAWGDAGIEIETVSPNTVGDIVARAADDAAIVSFTRELAVNNRQLKAVAVDSAGASIWKPAATIVSDAASNKTRLAMAPADDDGFVVVWQDARGGTEGIYAQNINADGSLGSAKVTGDVTGDGFVDAADLASLLASWGKCAACAADLNGDGQVGASDLGTLLANWT